MKRGHRRDEESLRGEAEQESEREEHGRYSLPRLKGSLLEPN